MEALPKYTLANLSGSHINQMGQFEDIINEANKKGIVNTPPSDEIETYDINSQKIRIQTIASRLWLLGYLPRKISGRNIRKKIDDIKSAVAHFQKDANLKQDNWVGDKTWYALDQLVSFESELNHKQWFANGEIRPEVTNAFHRAIQLRLWSLGLYKNSPNKNFKTLTKNVFKNFKSILQIFLIKHDWFAVGFNVDTLKILFNQDFLTHAIALRSSGNQESFLLKLPDKKKEIQQKTAQKFIVNCAKIELWLLGYEVKIDGRNDFELSTESDLYVAISHYYQYFENFKKAEADELAKKITPRLFEGMAAANELSYDQGSDDNSEKIIKILTSNNDIDKAWDYVKDKGMRLWDGLKRIWRWIKKIGEKAASFIEKNIFKAFFRYASKTYKIIKKGISEVVKSLAVYVKGELTSPGVYIQFSKDMDTSTYLPKNLSTENARLGIDKLTTQSKAFGIACRIIGWLFDVFKNMATGFAGWARLLYSLVLGYKELKSLYHDFKTITAES